ncbi:hypothetical protein SAMN05444841_11111 [Enterobacter kobei]|nr:hypothetical protein SAMN05444841_11111 [Enterobacter kobei]
MLNLTETKKNFIIAFFNNLNVILKINIKDFFCGR